MPGWQSYANRLVIHTMQATPAGSVRIVIPTRPVFIPTMPIITASQSSAKEEIVYLVQPGTLIGTNRYKIGRSKSADLRRVKSYGKNTIFIHVINVKNSSHVEKVLKNEFNSKFKLFAGQEYFECDHKDLISKAFIDIVSKYVV